MSKLDTFDSYTRRYFCEMDMWPTRENCFDNFSIYMRCTFFQMGMAPMRADDISQLYEIDKS